MTLEVEAPGSYEAERRYILDVMLGERLGLDWRLRLDERPDVRITSPGDSTRCVRVPDVLFATPPRDWLAPAALPARPLTWTEAPWGQRVPVLFGGDASAGPIVPGEDGVALKVDVFGGSFFMLSRYEEIVLPARDRFGRFTAAASLAHAEGFLELPIVDAYVEILWSALQALWPRLERRPPNARLGLSCDVDRPLASAGKRAPALLRALGADALVRRDPGLAVRRVRSWAGLRRDDFRLDPYNTFEFLMDVGEMHGSAAAFNFLATEKPTPQDGPYTLEQPWIQSLIARIHERGHEIGFHASFHSHLDPESTGAEFLRLQRTAERQGVVQECWGGRQHYLRWENPVTWSNWEVAGLDYDSTVGYADHIGFRAGTCHEFPVFHLRERRALRLRERPLHVMDATLFEYMRLSRDAALGSVLALARECRRYGGVFSLLWHNSSLPGARDKRWYQDLVGTLSDCLMLDLK
jgi:hypothetical protein